MGRRGKTFRTAHHTSSVTGRALPVLALIVMALVVVELHFYAGWLTGGRIGTIRTAKVATLPPRNRVYFIGEGGVMDGLEAHVDAHLGDVVRAATAGGDMGLLHQAHAVVADVTEPSFDLGYQLAMAEANRIPVLALVRGRQGEGSTNVESRLPATLVHNTGSWAAVVKGYADAGEARSAVDAFIAVNEHFASRAKLSVQLSGKVSP